MCGIFGIISKRKEKYNSIVQYVIDNKKHKILANLYNRGSKTNGEYQGDKCYLLHTQSDSVDTPQPYITNNIILILDGEIHNCIELRNELLNCGYKFNTQSDIEVIAKLYENMGCSCFNKLIGNFAICLYDTKQQQVFLCRDRMGVKPLFYHENNNVIIFASDIISVIDCLDNDKKNILPTSISSYLSFQSVLGQNTFFEEVKKLKSGYYLMVHGNVSIPCEYWKLNTEDIDVVTNIYDSEHTLSKLLLDATYSNIPKNGDINIFLSGGLDSSTITYYANEINNKENSKRKIRTFSIGFDNCNEFEYADLVADKFQTEHTNITVSTDDYIENMIDLISFKGEPLSEPNEPLIYIMAKTAKTNNNIVLTGDGADELLFGYGQLFDIYYKYLNDTSIPFCDYFMEHYTRIPENYKKSILTTDMWKERVLCDNTLKNIFSELFNECVGVHYQDSIGYVMLKLHLQHTLSKLDNATMCASVTGRVPFIEHDIVDYCFYRIHREHKIKLLKEFSLMQLMDKTPQEISEVMDEPKYILKCMMEKLLPVEVTKRKRINFIVPLEQIFAEKFEIIVKFLERGYIRKMNMFSIDELVKRVSNRTLQEYDILTIWSLLNLEIFSQLFMFNVHIRDIKSFFLVDPQYKYEKTKLMDKIIINRDIQQQRYIKLFVIKSLFEKYNIEYFACGGTMLGCVRHRGFIPWDDNINLMIMNEQCSKITDEFRFELLFGGFQIKKSMNGYKIFDYLDDNTCFINITVMRYTDTDETSICYASNTFDNQSPNVTIMIDELYPLVEYKFGFFELTGMKNSENYFIKRDFGDYFKSATITKLHSVQNNDMLQSFMNKYNLKHLLIRDISLLTRIDNVVETDDWKQYFIRAKEYIPFDFNPHNYLLLNRDLSQDAYTDIIDVYIHYIKHGRIEGRLYNIETALPLEFDVRGYKCLNPDLKSLTDNQLKAHYIIIGRNCNRKYNIKSLIPYDFEPHIYAYLNPDLDNLGGDEDKLINHYINFGKNEKRIYIKDIPPDFNYNKYLLLNPDIRTMNERDTIIHYIKIGRNENRNWK